VLKKLKERLRMPVAAGALALAMMGLNTGTAQAASVSYAYPGAAITWSADGEILTVKDTKSDGRYIYTMGMFVGTNEYLTPHCSTRGLSSKTCNYSVAEKRKISFWVYSVKGTDMRKIGAFTVTA